MSRVSMNYNNSIAQVTPVCYCYLCVSILRALNEIKIPIWRQTITYFEQLGLRGGRVFFSNMVLKQLLFISASSRNEIFREIAIIYKNSWNQFTLEDDFTKFSKKKTSISREKQKNSVKTMTLIFSLCFIFPKKKKD